MNVLKPHLQTTVFTLLAAGKSQREIARITEIDRKSIRRLERLFVVALSKLVEKSHNEHNAAKRARLVAKVEKDGEVVLAAWILEKTK